MSATPEQQNTVNIAVMQTELTHLKSGMADLKATNAQQNAKLDKIVDTLAEARGGWRTLMMVGGAAGLLGGFVNWIFSHWKG